MTSNRDSLTNMADDRRPVKSRREDFARDGFVVLEEWIASSELETIRLDVDMRLPAPHAPGCSRPNNVLLPLRWCDSVVGNLLASERRVQAIRDSVSASDLRWISGYFSIKEARNGPLWWHQDWWCWDHPVSFRRAAPQIAVLCYLTDTDRERGALRLLPGSHVRSSTIHSSLAEPHREVRHDFVEPDSPLLTDYPEQVTLEATAGDAVIIDYRLLHGTHANESELPFFPPWAGGNQAVVAILGEHAAAVL